MFQHRYTGFPCMCHWRPARIDCRKLGNRHQSSLLLAQSFFLRQSVENSQQAHQMETFTNNGIRRILKSSFPILLLLCYVFHLELDVIFHLFLFNLFKLGNR